MTTHTDPNATHRITQQTLALILAGGQGSRLHELTKWRAKPAVPFGGKFRIIDFALSNCINSGIKRVGVITQYKSHSLVRHITRGWSGNREFGQSVEILPASKRTGDDWYEGTADAVYQNLDIIRTHRAEQVLILGGDHIYKMDYGTMLSWHRETNADITVSCIEVATDEARGSFGVVQVDDRGRVIGFEEKPMEPAEIPGKPGRVLASMGNYVFSTRFLYDRLIEDTDNPDSSHDFGKDIIPKAVGNCEIFAHTLGGNGSKEDTHTYWRDVGTLDAYWDANIELVDFRPELDLYDKVWPIYTYQAQLPSAKFVHDTDTRRGMAVNCIVSGGCLISGASLRRSILFSNVHARSYSHIEESVVMPDVTIERNCTIRNAIIDTGCIIPPNTSIGIDADEDRANGFRVTDRGITLVTPDQLGQNLHLLR